MVEQEYLHRGLSALARAWQANSMAGHLGAAVVAGYCLAEDRGDLDSRVVAGIQGEMDRIIAGEEQWFDPDSTGITVPELFEAIPVGDSAPQSPLPIADALSGNIDALRQSGHNVIFAALAIKALQTHPEYAAPEIVDGIRKLIEMFDGAHPGRAYFGSERGWTTGDKVAPAEDSSPIYTDDREMAQAVARLLVETASEHRQGCGGLWHIINHAAALSDLGRLGHGDLARRGYPAHAHHVRIWRALPDLTSELGAMKQAEHAPLDADYWETEVLRRDRALLTHRIKTMYGFEIIAGRIDDPGLLARARQAYLYLMA